MCAETVESGKLLEKVIQNWNDYENYIEIFSPWLEKVVETLKSENNEEV